MLHARNRFGIIDDQKNFGHTFCHIPQSSLCVKIMLLHRVLLQSSLLYFAVDLSIQVIYNIMHFKQDTVRMASVH